MVAVSRPAMADGEDDELLASLAAQRLRRIKVAVAARRKQVAAAVAAFSSCGQGPQGKKRREAAFSWEDHLARLTEDEFKQRYILAQTRGGTIANPVNWEVEQKHFLLPMTWSGGAGIRTCRFCVNH